jgi:hypothetical protein
MVWRWIVLERFLVRMSTGGGGFRWGVQGFVQSFQADIGHLSRLDYGRFLPDPFLFFNRQSFYHSTVNIRRYRQRR